MTDTDNPSPLRDVRVLDLTRILAGPTCTQLLGDLGCDVIKIERPGAGDDTRKWGPPYVVDAHGKDTHESAYYLSSNRNKRSVAVDIAKPEGQDIVRRLAAASDVLVENFKTGGLAQYGLDYESLKESCPRLVYCSITGFGRTGPYAPRAGYDLLAQGMGGIMSITGAPDGEPMKVGVGISDVMAGMYAATAILAALRHRDATDVGQFIDIGLLDVQVAWLVNEGVNYLLSGQVPKRQGNAHPNIVPYQTFEAADGHIILAVGNDAQFGRFCDFAGVPELADDERFRTNSQRIRNRDALIPLLRLVVRERPAKHWLDGMEALGVPAAAVNTLDQVFSDPQVLHRGMKITMAHPLADSGTVDLIANPVKFSESPVSYRHAPPILGQHTDQVLAEVLGLEPSALAGLRARSVI